MIYYLLGPHRGDPDDASVFTSLAQTSAKLDAVITARTIIDHLLVSEPHPSFTFNSGRETHAHLLPRRLGPEWAYSWVATRYQTTCE